MLRQNGRLALGALAHTRSTHDHSIGSLNTNCRQNQTRITPYGTVVPPHAVRCGNRAHALLPHKHTHDVRSLDTQTWQQKPKPSGPVVYARAQRRGFRCRACRARGKPSRRGFDAVVVAVESGQFGLLLLVARRFSRAYSRGLVASNMLISAHASALASVVLSANTRVAAVAAYAFRRFLLVHFAVCLCMRFRAATKRTKEKPTQCNGYGETLDACVGAAPALRLAAASAAQPQNLRRPA